MMVAEDDPPTVREFAPSVPKPLEAVCLKCLAKNPADRYPTAGDLADDLQRVLDGDPPSAAKASALGGVWSALGRGRQAVEFAGYAGIFTWMAVVMAVTDVVVCLAVNGRVPLLFGPAAHAFRLVAFIVVVASYRRGRLRPRTPAERTLWSLWGGYLLACIASAWTTRMRIGWETPEEVHLYPGWTVLTALAFFALGASFWGWFYAFGLAFLLAAFVAAAVPPVSPLCYGGLWAVVLLLFARHLRKLARETGEGLA
jgi:hypothetical protein